MNSTGEPQTNSTAYNQPEKRRPMFRVARRSETKPGLRSRMEILVTTAAAVRSWGSKRWMTAAAAGALWLLASGIPTGIIETPLYERMTPVLWWNYPFWAVNAGLVGLLSATYLSGASPANRTGGRFAGGGLLSVIAIGCPVCNKLVIMALGAGGAMRRPVSTPGCFQPLKIAMSGRIVGNAVLPHAPDHPQPG